MQGRGWGSSALALALVLAAAEGTFGASAAACEVGTYYNASVLAAMQSQSGAALQATVNEVIRANTVDNDYGFAWSALKIADAWEGNVSSGLVHELYANRPWPADDTVGNGVTGNTGWNREHVWPNSRGIHDVGADYADLHNLHVEDMNVNSARGNLPFDNCDNNCTAPADPEAPQDTGRNTGFFMPPALHRGDVARTILYMATRYDGRDNNTLKLQVTDCPGSLAPNMMGRLTTLLEWHRLDPPSARELYRNGAVCGFQGNRNPFVDFPELANKIFGPGSGYVDPVEGCATAGQITPTVTAMPTVVPSVPTVPTPFPTKLPTSPTTAPTPFPSVPTVPTPGPSAVPSTGELVEGEVAMVGYNSITPRSVALVLLNDMRAGANFSMTDNAYNGTALQKTEGVVTFTANATLPRGTVLVWTTTATGWSTSTAFALSSNGDNVLLYSGTPLAPRFHYALTYNVAFDAPALVLNASQCALPATLTAGKTALALPKFKGGRYSGPTVGSRDELLASISNPSGWTQSDTVDLAALPAFTVQVPTPAPTAKPTAAPSKTPSAAPTAAPTTGELVEGDVAIVGYNANTPKSVALVLLKDMRAGANFSMTDNAYNGTALKTNEGVVTFTANATLPRGTVLVWNTNATGWSASLAFALSTSGDNAVLYSGGLLAPRFHYAFTYNVAFDAPSSALTANQCALPATLTAGKTALALPKFKGGRYSGPTVGSRDELLASISNPSLWTQSDTLIFDLAALPAFTVQASTGGAPTPAPTTAAPTTAAPTTAAPTTAPSPTLSMTPSAAPSKTPSAAPTTLAPSNKTSSAQQLLPSFALFVLLAAMR
jgi:endonuclease I